MVLKAVIQEVNRLDNSAVLHEVEFAMKWALYGRLWSLCNQYNAGKFSWFSIYPVQTQKWSDKMIIGDRLLISRSAFVCFNTTKFLYSGINVMKPSDNNNNIVSGFFSRNQDILHMKFLDTLFQM